MRAEAHRDRMFDGEATQARFNYIPLQNSIWKNGKIYKRKQRMRENVPERKRLCMPGVGERKMDRKSREGEGEGEQQRVFVEAALLTVGGGQTPTRELRQKEASTNRQAAK